MHLITSCTKNSPRFKSPNIKRKKKSKNMEFAKFHNLHKNKQSPMSITTQSSTCKKKKKHNLSKECTCSIPWTRYSTSGARARVTSGDKLVIPMLCAMTSIVSLATILIFFQTQKRTKTFFVSKKLPHLTETKPATVYSWILVERTGKSGARGKEQYLRGGEAGGVQAPRQFPASGGGGEDGFFRRR